MGCGRTQTDFLKNFNLTSYTVLKRSHRSLISYIQLNFLVILTRFRHSIASVHVVDEQCLLPLLPSLLGCKIVLDIFDSIFLKFNFGRNNALLAKRFLYWFCHRLIVTDNARFDLLPDFARSKAIVVPNVPYAQNSDESENSLGRSQFQKADGRLRLALFGTVSKDRGFEFARSLCRLDEQIEIHIGGWIKDQEILYHIENDDSFILHDYMTQDETIKICRGMDAILAIYPNNNLNNIYASPNKLYDAIHAGRPIIAVTDILFQRIVSELGLGLCLERSEVNRPTQKTVELIRELSNFEIPSLLSMQKIYMGKL